MHTGWSWRFYGARIAAVNDDGTYFVEYDDGDIDRNISGRHIRRVFDTDDYELHEIHNSARGFTHVNVQEGDGSWVPIDIYKSNDQENGVILSFGKGKFEGLTGGYTLIDGKLRDGDGDEIKYEIPEPVNDGEDSNTPWVKDKQKEGNNDSAAKDYHSSPTRPIKQTSGASPQVNVVAINERIDYLFHTDGQRTWYSGTVRKGSPYRDWFKVIIH